MKQLFDTIRSIKGAPLTQAEVNAVNAALTVATLRPSVRCEAFIRDYEKCRLTAYLPTPNDVPTIGWGSTGPDIRLGMTWTQAQADTRFASDLSARASGVLSALRGAPTTQGEFDAMVSLAYNIGLQAFRESTLLRLHLEGDRAGAAAQFLRWNKQAGKVLDGLTKRRTAEAAMYRAQA